MERSIGVSGHGCGYPGSSCPEETDRGITKATQRNVYRLEVSFRDILGKKTLAQAWSTCKIKES